MAQRTIFGGRTAVHHRWSEGRVAELRKLCAHRTSSDLVDDQYSPDERKYAPWCRFPPHLWTLTVSWTVFPIMRKSARLQRWSLWQLQWLFQQLTWTPLLQVGTFLELLSSWRMSECNAKHNSLQLFILLIERDNEYRAWKHIFSFIKHRAQRLRISIRILRYPAHRYSNRKYKVERW